MRIGAREGSWTAQGPSAPLAPQKMVFLVASAYSGRQSSLLARQKYRILAKPNAQLIAIAFSLSPEAPVTILQWCLTTRGLANTRTRCLTCTPRAISSLCSQQGKNLPQHPLSAASVMINQNELRVGNCYFKSREVARTGVRSVACLLGNAKRST